MTLSNTQPTPPSPSPEGVAGGSQSPRRAAEYSDLGFDVHRLDCAVDALRDARISPDDRASLVRIANNLMDVIEAA